MANQRHVYAIRPRKDHRGVDLISDALSWVGCGLATRTQFSKAIGYAKFRSRSHDAVIRVYDESGNVIETPRARGRFQRVVSLPSIPLRLQICLRSRCSRGRFPSRSELSARAHHEQQNEARVL
jgi:hypothetical protein